MGDKAQFIQILDSTKFAERSQKFEQWKQIEDSIMNSTMMKLKSAVKYKLFRGKRAESDLEPEFKHDLQEYMLRLLT